MSIRLRFLAAWLLLISGFAAWVSDRVSVARADEPLPKPSQEPPSKPSRHFHPWQGEPRAVRGVPKKSLVTIGYPEKQRTRLTAKTTEPLEPGVYRLTMRVAASHVADEIAWKSELIVKVNEALVARHPAIDFGLRHHFETRSVEFVQRQSGPATVELSAAVPADVFERAAVKGKLDQGDRPDKGEAGNKQPKPALVDDDLVAELTVGLSPESHVYFLSEEATVERLSTGVVLRDLEIDRIRYQGGDPIRGRVTVDALGAKNTLRGTLVLELESSLAQRQRVKEIPLELNSASKFSASRIVEFECTAPREELGHALRVVFEPQAGPPSRQVASVPLLVLANFNRASIWGGLGAGHGTTFRDKPAMDQACRELRANYQNACEQFAWAEEDMVEMSPEADVWYSGQTCYRINKPGLQQLIASAHEQGIAMTTYGKFVMSGYLGWKTAWDYPADHRGQFVFPVGMWEGCNVPILDRFRFKEFVPYEHSVNTGGLLKPFWQAFLPINPDPTPRMTRIAAEETVRSIEMFGWDGIRWDGHMRGGGPTGGAPGEFSYDAARRTETLLRYFKEIVAQSHPRFTHGYNYLFVQEQPSYDWAHEDFELDEICRGGGLLMNESIGNTTAGRKFDWLAQNLQVEGDLARERGGYLLGISYADNPRDAIVESAIYFAGGCRPMGGAAKDPRINRYGTRYACYTFDETLRRLATPENVLQPAEPTKLWWQPFVFETRPDPSGNRQLVVNLLNLPRDAVTRGGQVDRPIDWEMPEGTAAVDFSVTLPDGFSLSSGRDVSPARLIDPFSLEVIDLPTNEGKVSVPAVDAWRVLILDVHCRDPKAASLAERFSPPRTFGVARPGLKVARSEPRVLDVAAPLEEVEKLWNSGNTPHPLDEDPELVAMNPTQRNRALLARKALPENSPQAFLEGWWKGGSLPADLKLRDQPPEFDNMEPTRDGVWDVFLARGAMSHRAKLSEGLATLPRYRVHEAQLSGFGVNYGLSNNITGSELSRFDLVVYADIPHAAIGVEQAYALVDYVRAGGGLLFTGGQYSFGKGGYSGTVLDRELLPVSIVETVDTRVSHVPLLLETGPDWDDLAADFDDSERPSLWVYNQVALRPDAEVKIFLTAGNRPILVGWELGEGRVACFLGTPMGQSTAETRLYSQWSKWPELLNAVFRWVAPATERWSATYGVSEKELASILDSLGKSRSTAVVDDLLDGDSGEKPSGNRPGNDPKPPGDETPRKRLKDFESAALGRRIQELEILLTALAQADLQSAETSTAANTASGDVERTTRPPNGKNLVKVPLVLAEQAVLIPNLPESLRWQIVRKLAMRPTPEFATPAKAGLASGDERVRGTALCLLALSGDDAFASRLKADSAATVDDDPTGRREMAMALALASGSDLVSEGRRRLDDWRKTETTRLEGYAGGDRFTLAAPAVPLLDSETLFERVGWLSYLARSEPARHTEEFAQHWARLAQLQAWCDTTEAGLWAETQQSSAARRGAIRGEVANVQLLKRQFGLLQELTRDSLLLAFEADAMAVARGFARCEFQHEAESAIGFLAALRRSQSREALEHLSQSPHPILSEFAKVRLLPQ